MCMRMLSEYGGLKGEYSDILMPLIIDGIRLIDLGHFFYLRCGAQILTFCYKYSPIPSSLSQIVPSPT